MHRTAFALVLGVSIVAVAAARSSRADDTRASSAASTSRLAERSPAETGLRFEPNLGQLHDDAEFRARARGYDAYIAGGAATLALFDGRTGGVAAALRLEVAGGTAGRPRAEGRLRGVSHYLMGDDPAAWVRDVPHYARVVAEEVRPGLDVEYRGDGHSLRFDLRLAPGAPTEGLTLRFGGADEVAVAENGTLDVRIAGERVTVTAPVAFQPTATGRQHVAAHWICDRATSARVVVGGHDPTRPLVIDPTVVYSSYHGGEVDEILPEVALGPERGVFIAAASASTDFPTTPGAYATSRKTPAAGSGYDVVVSKYTAGLGVLKYSTYIGGTRDETAYGIVVDGDGDAYVALQSFSDDFPLVSAFDAQPNFGSPEAVLLKLRDDGTAIEWSTYVGNGHRDAGGVALDSSDRPVVLTAGAHQLGVAKFAADGQSQTFSTTIGLTSQANGSSQVPAGIDVDGSDNVVIAAYTRAHTIATTSGAFQEELPGYNSSQGTNQPESGVVFKLSATGTVTWGTYVGGAEGNDAIRGVAVADNGEVVIVGETQSSDYPLKDEIQTEIDGFSTGFLTRLESDGSDIVWSTYFGADGRTYMSDVAIDKDGDIHVVGFTSAVDLPVTEDAYQSSLQATGGGSDDGWLARFSSASELEYCSYLGSTGDDSARSLVLDCHRVLVVGYSRSSSDDSFPSVRAHQPESGGRQDLFLTSFSETFSIVEAGDVVPEWSVGRPLSHQFRSQGQSGDITWSHAGGAIPPGMTLSSDGLLSGSPDVPVLGPVTIEAHADCGIDAYREFQLVVNPVPQVAGDGNLAWTAGAPLDVQLRSSGGTGAIVFGLDEETAPEWLAIADDGSLSGTPPAPETVRFDVTVTDVRDAVGRRTMTLLVNPPPRILTSALEECTEDVAHAWQLSAADGTAPLSWGLVGLAAGELSVDDLGALTGDVGGAGVLDVIVEVTDAAGSVVQRTLALQVNAFPEIETAEFPLAAMDRPYDVALVGSGGTPFRTWSTSSQLPTGILMDPVRGRVHGTPLFEGDSVQFVHYTDGRGAEATRTMPFTVVAAFPMTGKKPRLDLEFHLLNTDAPTHRYLELLRGTSLSMKLAFKGEGGFPLDVALLDANGTPLPIGDHAKEKGRKFTLKKLSIPATGRYFLRLTPRRQFVGDVSVVLSAKAQTSFSGEAVLPDGDTLEVPVPMLAGAKLTFSVKAAKKSPALPEITELVEGADDLLGGGKIKTKKRASTAKAKNRAIGGEAVVRVVAREGAGGAVRWKAKVSARKRYTLELLDSSSP